MGGGVGGKWDAVRRVLTALPVLRLLLHAVVYIACNPQPGLSLCPCSYVDLNNLCKNVTCTARNVLMRDQFTCQ